MKPHPLLLTVVLPLMSLTALGETSSSSRTAAYENSVEQSRLREKATRLKAEMLQLLEDFRQYPGASEDITQAETVVQNLNTLSEKDMLSVIETLREASRANASPDADSRLVQASNGQKTIQSALRAVADRLALQKDSAAVQLRVRALLLRQITNRQQAENLADGSVQRKAAPVMTAEQEALHSEIGLLLGTLKKLATSPQITARQAFAAALIAGDSAQISARSDAAVAAARQLDFAATIASGGQVADALQAIVTALNSTTPKEVQAQALAARMKELADSQSQLASNTLSAEVKDQKALRQNQQRISNEAEAVAREASQLNPQAVAETTKAMQAMQNASNTLKANNSLKNAENRVSAAQAQTEASKNLAEAASMLDQQAGKSASDTAESSSSDTTANSDPASQAQDPAAAAISKAASQVMAAQQQMQAAKQFLRSSQASQAGQQMQAAQDALAQAAASAAEAGAGLPEGVGDSLKKAGESLQKSESLAGSDSRKAQNNLNGAQAHAADALQALQQAANKLAAAESNSSQQGSQGSQGSPSGGKSKGGNPSGASSQNAAASAMSTDLSTSSSPGGGGGGMATGDIGYGHDPNLNVTVSSRLSPQDRAALATLQREPAPEAYRDRVQQYFKNLAAGSAPGSITR